MHTSHNSRSLSCGSRYLLHCAQVFGQNTLSIATRKDDIIGYIICGCKFTAFFWNVQKKFVDFKKKLYLCAQNHYIPMKNELNALIMEAMKNHDSVRTESLRAIKSAFLNWSTSKENAGKEMTEADEIQIIKKMVKQRQESVEQYLAAGRQELADAEQAQIDVLETFLPKAASEQDIVRAFNAAKEANGWEAEKKNMGLFVKAIKAALPNADGKMVAQVVQSQLV